MGRLTLNVLLSFARFERELSSERVRDKVAASRRKGKWTGGTVPLGYDAKDKKLVINKAEAETVCYILRYLELQSFAKLVEDLDRKGIVTKRRDTKLTKYEGGIPFTYGPLAHFLKNASTQGTLGTRTNGFRASTQPSSNVKHSIRLNRCLSPDQPDAKPSAPDVGEICLPERPARRHKRPVVGIVTQQMLLRRKVDSDRRKREAGRDVGQRVPIDRVEIDRRLIPEFDPQQSVRTGRKCVGGGQSGVDAGNDPRRVGRCQGLAVDPQCR
jgi:hypothetical protein